jgi:hypothetical protein
METRIKKEINDLVDNSYEIFVYKQNSNNIITDEFKINLCKDYPFKSPSLFVYDKNEKNYIEVNKVKEKVGKKINFNINLNNILSMLLKDVLYVENIISNEYSPTISLLDLTKKLVSISNKLNSIDI